MYVSIGIPTYTEIKNLTFAPEVDIAGTSVPINEFTVDIITDDDIPLGIAALLYDDLDNLWAQYTVVYAERVDRQTVRVRARSDVAVLDTVTLPATMYETTAAGVMGDIFGSVSASYSLHSSFSSAAVKGFCPQQTARERLAWLCLVLGAYVKSCFNTTIQILPVPGSGPLIPLNRTYWRPSVTYLDYVTSFAVTAYAFEEAEPETTDEWVETDGGVVYVVTRSGAATMPAPGTVPEGAIGRAMQVEDVMLVNADNLSTVLTHLSTYYFNRLEVDADVIDNAEFVPGQKVTVYADENTLVTGYIQRAEFAFGLQARARLHIVGVESVPSATLVIQYVYDGDVLDSATYTLPVGYGYSFDNPYLDITKKKVRRVYRPLTAAATGTVQSGTNTVTVEYAVALELEDGILTIISVDDIELDVDGEDYVGVIS